MAKKKIVIRVDGNSKIGLGHIYRGIALAEMLKDEFIIQFVIKSDSTTSPIQDSTFDFIFVPDNIELLQEPFWFKENYSTDTILILDGYNFTEVYQRSIKTIGYKLVYIDDFAKSHMYADLVINHSPGVKKEDYKSESYTKFALGTNYAILRPLFLEAAKHSRGINKIDTAFVCFGGTDIYDHTYIVTKALLRLEQFKKINIVIGGAYNHKKIFELQKQHSIITIYNNISEKDLLKVMRDSHFAIAPASTILYELCSVKIPVLSGFCAENQKGILKSLLHTNAIFSCNDMRKMSEKDFENKILECIKSDYKNQTRIQKNLFDGISKSRIIKSVNALEFRLRNANSDDLELLYSWVNDKDVRNNALNPKTINYEEHCSWFYKIINNNTSILYILEELNGNPIGQIRFNLNNGQYIISYSIDSRYRGKGFGEIIILEGIERLKQQLNTKITLLAQVKKHNIASIKIFSKLDFEEISNADDIILFTKNI